MSLSQVDREEGQQASGSTTNIWLAAMCQVEFHHVLNSRLLNEQGYDDGIRQAQEEM